MSMQFKMEKFGNLFGTRKLGEKIRDELFELAVSTEEEIEIDFKDIKMISQSFADECFGKLVIKLGYNEFNEKFLFINMNKKIESIINLVVANRFNE